MEKDESARSPRGRYAKGLARREVLLDVALRLFSAGGWEAASLSAVADAAGVSREAVRHYFPSRSVLLQEVLADSEARFRAAVGGGADKSMTGRLLLGRERAAAAPAVVALVANLTAHAITDGVGDLRGTMQERLWGLESDLAEAIQKAQADGELRSDIPARVLARLILGASDGLAAHDLLLGRTESDVLPTLLELFAFAPAR